MTADIREGLDPGPWLAAQAGLALPLAEAALAMGRLDAALAALPEPVREGMRHRLALLEAEAMLAAQGTPLSRDEIGRDLMDLRAGTDLEAMRLARWAIRRLQGQGAPSDLRGFLGLHRVTGEPGMQGDLAPRPAGEAFDDSARSFLAAAARLSGLHPIARASALQMLWRLAGLSPPGLRIEAAVWTARAMAAEMVERGGARFVPLGRHGRLVWGTGGTPADQLARQLAATRDGCDEARLTLIRLRDWLDSARSASADLKGGNPARVLEVLMAHPLASAAIVETHAGISRITAERLLNRLTGMGLLREITGTKRFRLWTAAL